MRRLQEGDEIRVRDVAELDGRIGVAVLVGSDAALVRIEGEDADRVLRFSQIRRLVGMDEINQSTDAEIAELNDATTRLLDAYRALEARLAPDASTVVRGMLGDIAQLGALYANLPPVLVPVAKAAVDALARKVSELASAVTP